MSGSDKCPCDLVSCLLVRSCRGRKWASHDSLLDICVSGLQGLRIHTICNLQEVQEGGIFCLQMLTVYFTKVLTSG